VVVVVTCQHQRTHPSTTHYTGQSLELGELAMVVGGGIDLTIVAVVVAWSLCRP